MSEYFNIDISTANPMQILEYQIYLTVNYMRYFPTDYLSALEDDTSVNLPWLESYLYNFIGFLTPNGR